MKITTFYSLSSYTWTVSLSKGVSCFTYIHVTRLWGLGRVKIRTKRDFDFVAAEGIRVS